LLYPDFTQEVVRWSDASGLQPSVQLGVWRDRRSDRSSRIESTRTPHRGPGHPTCPRRRLRL